MAFKAYEFTFNGRSCREFGLIMCDFNGADRVGGTHTAGGKPQMETVFLRHSALLRGVEDDEKLSFPLSFGLCPDRIERQQFLDRFEIEEISSWLIGHRGWGWLTIEQNDLAHVRYRCMITDLKEISSGWDTYGFTCTVQCDSHYAYMFPQEDQYNCDGELNINFFNRSSMNDPYFPSLVIEPLGSRGVSIVNQSLGGVGPAWGDLAYVNGEKLAALPSLVGLKIRMDENGVLTNSEGLNLYPYYNFEMLGLVRGENKLVVTGKCNLTIRCEFPVDVGA